MIKLKLLGIKQLAMLYIYFFVLLFNVKNIMFPIYGYYGLTYSFSWMSLLLSLFYIGLMSCVIPKYKNKLASFFLLILLILTIAPMLVLYSINQENNNMHKFVAMHVVCFILISMISNIKFKVMSLKNNLIIGEKLLIVFLVFITLYDIARYIKINGFGIFNLNINNVYNYRFILRESMAGFGVYVDNWVVKVINPFCIIYAMHTQKRILICFFVVLQILLFGFSSHKFTLFIIFIVFATYYMGIAFVKSTIKMLQLTVLGSLLPILVYFTAIENVLTKTFYALYLRIFVMPAQINFWYYDYFLRNGFDWFHQSFLRHFYVSKYDLLLPRIIGLNYFGNASNNANTGFLASGYAQGGFIVMLVYSVIVGLIISFIVSASRYVNTRILLAMSVCPLMILFSSNDLPTSILTGGICWVLLLIYLMCKFNIIKNSQIN